MYGMLQGHATDMDPASSAIKCGQAVTGGPPGTQSDGRLEHLPSCCRKTETALKCKLGVQSLEIAADNRYCQFPAVPPIGDPAVLLFDRPFNLRLVPILGVPDIGDG